MRGNIFDIKRYAIHDGPGNTNDCFLERVSFALSLDVDNPEGQAVGTVSMKQVRRKLGDREFEEIRKVGYGISVDELVEEIAKDAVFFEESGGGVTFSGGEPLLQPVFLLECLKAWTGPSYPYLYRYGRSGFWSIFRRNMPYVYGFVSLRRKNCRSSKVRSVHR